MQRAHTHIHKTQQTSKPNDKLSILTALSCNRFKLTLLSGRKDLRNGYFRSDDGCAKGECGTRKPHTAVGHSAHSSSSTSSSAAALLLTARAAIPETTAEERQFLAEF